MIIGIGGLYALTVLSVLCMILRGEYKHMRRDWIMDQAPEAQPDRQALIRLDSRPNRRLNQALVRWTEHRAQSDLAVAAAPVLAVPPAISTEAKPQPAPEREPASAIPEPPAGHKDFISESTSELFESEPMETKAQNIEHDRVEDQFEILDTPQTSDYYEVLQISRNADMETIHRVYRIMAGRFHPDNPKTGDVERFLRLRQAYQVLSDPAQRAEYDAAHQVLQTAPLPIFELKDFVDGVQGEVNRRLGVLSLLYHRRRMNEVSPGISVLELERCMAFPREYLSFTLWYLRSKQFIIVMDENSDFAVTALGVDYLESNSSTNRVIRELLTSGSGAGTQQYPAGQYTVPITCPAPKAPVKSIRNGRGRHAARKARRAIEAQARPA
jgi:curved DNA-binding protein